MVELLVYIGLLSLFLTILTTLFVSIFKLQLTTQSTSALTQDTRFILARMGYDIENAESITNPNVLGSISNSLTLRDSANNSLTYALDAENDLTLNGEKINGIDTVISALTFQLIGTDADIPTIQVKFTIDSSIEEQSGIRSQSIQTTYGLR